MCANFESRIRTKTEIELEPDNDEITCYMTAMENYLSCIEAEEAAAVLQLVNLDERAKRQRADMFNKKYNAAVEEMNLVAEEFNLQVRTYKQRDD